MEKIPVKATIVECYRFAGKKYFELLGILWLPHLASLVLAFVFGRYLATFTLTKLQQSGGSAGYGFLGLQLFVNSIMGAAITRLVLGTFTGSRLVYFRIGRAELWTFAGLVLATTFVYGILFAGAILGGLIVAIVAVSAETQTISPGQFNPMLLMFIALILAVSVIPALFIALRLGFFIVPISVLENRLGLFRSWELTKGNFLRCLAITTAVLLPIILVATLATYTIYHRELNDIIGSAFKPGAMQAFVRGAQTASNSVPYIWPISVLFAPISPGLWLLPGPIVYRNLRLASTAEPVVNTDTAPA